MHPHPWIRVVAPLLAVVALTGCLLVENFAPAWDKGENDSCTNKIAESLYFSEFRRDPAGKDMNALAHTLTLGKFHFLMLKKETADAGGRMYRFGIINGIFQRYRLNPAMRATFEKDYPNAPVSLKHDTVELAALDAPTIALLTEISNKPEYWEIEDQTLYNTLRNPACKYEDRDLKAIDAPAPTKPIIKPKAK